VRAANGFLSAVQFLTRLPVPRGRYRLEDAVPWLPAVGLLLGAILAAVDLGLRSLGVGPLLASTLLVVLLLALSGALHADGLIDTSDAVFAHATPERRLDIMRDPRVGSFGAVALVSVVALKIAALDSLPSTTQIIMLLLTPMLGRWAIVLAATLFPYGREVGLGAPLKASATPRVLAFATILPLAGCALAGPLGLLSGMVAAAIALAMGRWLTRLLPGLTGDTYGAICEVVEASVWLGASIAATRAPT
jgi:adenosylcobinamide-GDP ribazoletransferase